MQHLKDLGFASGKVKTIIQGGSTSNHRVFVTPASFVDRFSKFFHSHSEQSIKWSLKNTLNTSNISLDYLLKKLLSVFKYTVLICHKVGSPVKRLRCNVIYRPSIANLLPSVPVKELGKLVNIL